MTTRRLESVATGLAGVDYLKTLVHAQYGIFHKIEQENDVGNNASIELVKDRKHRATLLLSK